MSKPIKPFDYQAAVFRDQRLSPTERVILLRIAWDFVCHQEDEHGWVELTCETLAAGTGLHRNTIGRTVDRLRIDGYLHRQTPISSNQYQAAKYQLSMAGFVRERATESCMHNESACDAEVRASAVVEPALDATRATLRRDARNTGVQRVLSTQTGGADDAPLSGGGGSIGKGKIKTAPPVPAFGGAEPNGAETENRNPQRDERSDPVSTDAAVFDDWDAAAEIARMADLVAVRPKDHDPMTVACPDPSCEAEPGDECRGRYPHLSRRLAVYAAAS